MKIKKYIKAMKENYQIIDKQTVLEHGVSVKNNFIELLTKINKNDDSIPIELKSNDFLKLLYPLCILKRYMIFHDIGKPYCKTIDEFG